MPKVLSAYGTFINRKERKQKLKKTGDLRFIFKN